MDTLSALKNVFCETGFELLDKPRREYNLSEAGAPFFSAMKVAKCGFLPGLRVYVTKPSNLSLLVKPFDQF